MSETLLVGLTGIERVGIFLAAGTVVAWIVYVVVTGRYRDPDEEPGSEIELAPNRRAYFDDEVLEGRRLEKWLGWALVLMILSAIGPIAYWLNEPSRQAGAVEEFSDQATERGRGLFLPTDSEEHGAHFGCSGCHGGMKAVGGSAPYTVTDFLGGQRRVTWAAPRLDTVLAKFSPEEVRQILIYGRANTPMPPWGVEGGGPMNAQQITDLVAYLTSIQVDRDQAREIAMADILNQAKQDGLGTDLGGSEGEVIFKANCARCHTKGWSFGETEVMGGGAFGPNLTNGTSLRQFPDVENMLEFVGLGSVYGAPYGVRGVGGQEGGGMPGFGVVLTEAQIRAVVEYVRGL